MKIKLFFLLFFIVSDLVCYSQITPTKVVWEEDFEYTTSCSEVVPGTTYGNSPQTYSPHGGSRHMYLNFVNNSPALTVTYEKTISGCSHTQEYNYSMWCKDTWGGSYSITFRVYDGTTLIVDDEIASANVGNAYYNYTTSFTSTSGNIRLQILNTWYNNGVGNYDVALDDILLTANNAYVSNDATLEYNEVVCDYTNLNLFSILNQDISINGTWSGASILSNEYLGTYSQQDNIEGNYYYNINSANNCPDTAYLVKTENVYKPINLGNDTLVCGEIELRYTFEDYDSYEWEDGSNSNTKLVTVPGQYSIEATTRGCTYSDEIEISACAPEVVLPNVFSPNGSKGSNDLFVPLTFSNVGEHKFTVFDRWGIEIYSTNNILKGWSGIKYDGKQLKSGTYYFEFKYKDDQGIEYDPIVGDISLF